MPITEATIAGVRFVPELLPDCQVSALVINTETTILNIRRVEPGKALVLDEIGLDRNANVELRIRADDVRIISDAGAVLDETPPSEFHTWFSKSCDVRLFSAANIANYMSYLSMWAVKPTVADKLKLGMPLSADDEKLAQDLGIRNSVEKGVLPLPLSYILEREYDIMSREVWADVVTLVAAAPPQEVFAIRPKAGQFVVLTSLAFTRPGAPDPIVSITRDNQTNYITFPTFPLTINMIPGIRCWIPAMDEILINLTSAAGQANFAVRATVLKCRLTNVIRARFGLVSRDEIPGETYDKVMAGVL